MSVTTSFNPEIDSLFDEYPDGFFGNEDPAHDPELREVTKGAKSPPEIE